MARYTADCLGYKDVKVYLGIDVNIEIIEALIFCKPVASLIDFVVSAKTYFIQVGVFNL